MADIHGLEEAKAKMRQIANPRKRKNACTRASRKAMNVVKKQGRINAKAIDDPDSPYKIWKKITTKAGKSRNKNLVIMRVGVVGGGGWQRNPDGYHWRFKELGTSTQPATPFLRPAFNNKQEEVTNVFVADFKEQLDKEIARS